jgi:hypothetical protein
MRWPKWGSPPEDDITTADQRSALESSARAIKAHNRAQKRAAGRANRRKAKK